MYVVPRTQLVATLVSTFYDPDELFQVEMSAFANAILADSQAAYFLITDHENGDDPEISYPPHSRISTTLIDWEKSNTDNGYYGLEAHRPDIYAEVPDDDRVVYHCFLAGCPAQSASGFVVSTVQLADGAA